MRYISSMRTLLSLSIVLVTACFDFDSLDSLSLREDEGANFTPSRITCSTSKAIATTVMVKLANLQPIFALYSPDDKCKQLDLTSAGAGQNYVLTFRCPQVVEVGSSSCWLLIGGRLVGVLSYVAE